MSSLFRKGLPGPPLLGIGSHSQNPIGKRALTFAFFVLVATGIPHQCHLAAAYEDPGPSDGSRTRAASETGDSNPTARQLAHQLMQALEKRDVGVSDSNLLQVLPSILPQVRTLGLDVAAFESEFRYLFATRHGRAQKMTEPPDGASATQKSMKISGGTDDASSRHTEGEETWRPRSSARRKDSAFAGYYDDRLSLSSAHDTVFIPTPELSGFGIISNATLSAQDDMNADRLLGDTNYAEEELDTETEGGGEQALDGQQLLRFRNKANKRQRAVNTDFDMVVGGKELLHVRATANFRSGVMASPTNTEAIVVPLVAASFDAPGESALAVMKAFDGDPAELRRLFAEAVIEAIPHRLKDAWNVSESDVRLFSVQDKDISIYLNMTNIVNRPEPTRSLLSLSAGCDFSSRKKLLQLHEGATPSPCVRIQWDWLDTTGSGENGTTELVRAVNADLTSEHSSYIMGNKSAFGRRARTVLGNVSSVAMSAYTVCGVPAKDQQQGPNVFQCYKQGVDFFGFDVKKVETGEINSPGECAEHCKFDDECYYWTFNPVRSWCYLKGVDAPQGVYSDPPATRHLISGLKNCDTLADPYPSEPCYRVGMDIVTTGYEHSIPHSTSALQCHAECTVEPFCFYWTFDSRQSICHLKGQGLVVAAQDSTRSSDALIAGAKRCKALQNHMRTTRRLMEIGGSEKLQPTGGNDTFFTARTPELSDCTYDDGDLYPTSEDIVLQTKAGNASDCHTACTQQEAETSSNDLSPKPPHQQAGETTNQDICAFWRFDEASGTCLLMGRHAWKTWKPRIDNLGGRPVPQSPETRTTTGSRRCKQFSYAFPPLSPLDLCFQPGIQFNTSADYVVREETAVHSLQQCVLLCSTEPKCISWTYMAKATTCSLLALDAHKVKRVREELSQAETDREEMVVSGLFGAKHCADASSSQLGEPLRSTEAANSPPHAGRMAATTETAGWGSDSPYNIPDDLPACAREGFMYAGHDLGLDENASQTHSARDCWRTCSRTHLCFFWSFDKVSRRCFLKDANAPVGGRSTRPEDFTSGPRYCPHAAALRRFPLLKLMDTASGVRLLPPLKVTRPFKLGETLADHETESAASASPGTNRNFSGAPPRTVSTGGDEQVSGRAGFWNGLPGGLGSDHQKKENSVSSFIASWLPFSGFRMNTSGGFLAREGKPESEEQHLQRNTQRASDFQAHTTQDVLQPHTTKDNPVDAATPLESPTLNSQRITPAHAPTPTTITGTGAVERHRERVHTAIGAKNEVGSTERSDVTDETGAASFDSSKGNSEADADAGSRDPPAVEKRATDNDFDGSSDADTSEKSWPCERDGVALMGADFFVAGDPGALTGVAGGIVMQSSQQCATYCASNPGCAYWTMDTESSLCYLKTADALFHYKSDQTTKHFVSGSTTAEHDCLL
ncbi:hypothetical protein BESB_062730 [Besnoitia besnoiti]|uniref:Apple domain-containing protein n=1 Tax=Besnoitia besnoiti TaxID=94643 RepID=A0A2A9MHF7_BESBE|nr:hypothetical protein BESB_062730 [Besnoitia besnoiti]PFH35386.1 hypothetical protein BESB_062730 [Besnoitia besnoiti]